MLVKCLKLAVATLICCIKSSCKRINTAFLSPEIGASFKTWVVTAEPKFLFGGLVLFKAFCFSASWGGTGNYFKKLYKLKYKKIKDK